MVNKRNIVLITLDSLRADHCSFMGYHRKTTPTMDKMAKKGLAFENAIAASVPTAPSMFCCFTGEYPLVDSFDFSFKTWRGEFIGKKTLAQVLSKEGYYTAAFHSNIWVSEYYGFTKGFKEYRDYLKEKKDIMNLMAPKSWVGKWKRRIDYIIKKTHPTVIPWEAYYEELINFVEHLKEPFFLWILLLDTHEMYLAPKGYTKYGFKNPLGNLYLYYLYWKAFSKKTITKLNKHIINAYDDAIYYADNFIKRFWKDTQDKDPILIIHADHGEGLGDHGFYWHPPLLYEELIHVPLIIYNVDIKGKIKKPVSLLGLAPTILDILYTNKNNKIFSSENFLKSSNNFVISKVFSNCKEKIAIRGCEWKYIEGQKDGGELYNLRKDPTEQENLIADYPDIVKDFKKMANIIIKRDWGRLRIKNKIRDLSKLHPKGG